MTHKDIYEKFMIEYDKANITSSYPSLTKYEIATLLDKAYLALIAQKLTGNNPRKAPFEYDVKAIEDLRPLITTATLSISSGTDNEQTCELPDDFMYYVTSYTDGAMYIQLINHALAVQFKTTPYNIPWMKHCVGYFEDESFIVLSPYYYNSTTNKMVPIAILSVIMTYIKRPVLFTSREAVDETVFELSDTIAEELINLAIVFATESVEQPRLQTKTSILSLES